MGSIRFARAILGETMLRGGGGPARPKAIDAARRILFLPVMDRRLVLGGIVATVLGWFGLRAQNSGDVPEYTTYGRGGEPVDIEGLKAALGYPVEEVHGSKALVRWRQLRAAGQGYPVIVGGPEDFAQFVEQADFAEREDPAEVIAAALAYRFPEALMEAKREELREYLERYPEDGPLEQFEADIGEWPEVAPEDPGLTVHADVLSNKPYARCFIVIFPTDKGYEVPAYANWGGWNANPGPEVHVAALRSWGERYGAELVGMNAATLNLAVTHRSSSREEALALAREQYAYCNDIVDQGVGSLANLAAACTESDWWYFWWD